MNPSGTDSTPASPRGAPAAKAAAPFDAPRLAVLLQSMHEAADAARGVTRPRFRATLTVEDKASGGPFDPVTDADRDAEALIREHLCRAHPDIGFLGEESGSVAAGFGPVGSDLAGTDPRARGARASRAGWSIRSTGRGAFITGMPLWGTLIALHDGRDVVLGLLDQPVLGERYVGGPDGATLHVDGSVRPLRARGGRTLGEAVLCCTTPEMFDKIEERARVRTGRGGRARLVRYGGDCYAYAQLAAGHVDVIVESDLKPWDVQALIPLVRGCRRHRQRLVRRRWRERRPDRRRGLVGAARRGARLARRPLSRGPRCAGDGCPDSPPAADCALAGSASPTRPAPTSFADETRAADSSHAR